jgi:hypothetical protein
MPLMESRSGSKKLRELYETLEKIGLAVTRDFVDQTGKGANTIPESDLERGTSVEMHRQRRLDDAVSNLQEMKQDIWRQKK